jgi:hypothetical protein
MQEEPGVTKRAGKGLDMKRREFLKTNMLTLAGGALAEGGADAAESQSVE